MDRKFALRLTLEESIELYLAEFSDDEEEVELATAAALAAVETLARGL